MNTGVLALGVAALCSAAALAATHTPVAITGCVRPGSDPDTYVLLDVDEVIDGRAAPAGAVYRLSSTKALRPHVGHKVEVRGTYSFEPDFGKTATVKVKTDPMKVQRRIALDNGAKQVESKDELRAVGTSGVLPTDEKPIYRRLQVSGVKMIGASCDVP